MYFWIVSIVDILQESNFIFSMYEMTVQQSSFYGYTSMLPSRYTQAVMTGESEYYPRKYPVILQLHTHVIYIKI